jgi:hypothetical protein
MNGAASCADLFTGIVDRTSGVESFSLDRQRRNKLALIPSRWQNSDTDNPLLDC